MLSPNEIAYIREWAEGGNEARHRQLALDGVFWNVCSLSEDCIRYRLNSAGLTIARLAAEIDEMEEIMLEAVNVL